MGRDTARLKQVFGTTDECLPGPPATTTSTSSGDGTWGGRCRQRQPGVLVHEALHVGAREAVAGDRARVLGAEHDQELALREVPADVRAERRRRVTDGGEDPAGRRRGVVVDVVGALAAVDGDGVTVLQGSPRRGLLVLGDAVRELGGAALRSHVVASRPGAADVHEDQSERATDRGVGAEARAEAPAARVQSDASPIGAVDDDQRRHRMGRRLHAVEVEVGIEHRVHRGDDDRKVLRTAAGHHGVDGDRLERRRPPQRGHGPKRTPGLGVSEHHPHAVGRRRDDGQAVAPLAGDERVENGLGRVVDFDGPERGAHAGPRRLASCSTACWARRATDSGRSPPSGCSITSKGRPATPRAESWRTASP